MSDDGFAKWIDHAQSLRDALRNQMRAINDGKTIWVIPAGFTKESWMKALQDSIESITASLKNFGRE